MIVGLTSSGLLIYASIMIGVLKGTCDKKDDDIYNSFVAIYTTLLVLTFLCFILYLLYKNFGVEFNRLFIFLLGLIAGSLLWLIPISHEIYIKSDKSSCLYNISIVSFTFTPIFILMILGCLLVKRKDVLEYIEKNINEKDIRVQREQQVNAIPLATATATPAPAPDQ